MRFPKAEGIDPENLHREIDSKFKDLRFPMVQVVYHKNLSQNIKKNVTKYIKISTIKKGSHITFFLIFFCNL